MTPAEKQEMFFANMPLVKHIAGRYKCPREFEDDMYQEGYLALWRAISNESYDPSKGAFSTFAGSYIQRALNDFTAKAMNRSGLTASSDTIRRIGRAKSQLDEVGDGITHEDLREALGTSNDKLVMRAYALISPAASTSMSRDDDDETERPSSFVIDDYDIDDTDEILRAAIDSLPKSLRDAIKKYYGIGCKPMTLQQIGDSEGYTRQCIALCIDKALDLLRERIPVSLNWTL